MALSLLELEPVSVIVLWAAVSRASRKDNNRAFPTDIMENICFSAGSEQAVVQSLQQRHEPENKKQLAKGFYLHQ